MIVVPFIVVAAVFGLIVLIGNALGPLDVPAKSAPAPSSGGAEHPPKPSA